MNVPCLFRPCQSPLSRQVRFQVPDECVERDATRITQKGAINYADRHTPRQHARGDGDAARAGAVEWLSALAIRQRRLSGALVRGHARTEPLNHLRPLPQRADVAPLLAGGAGAGGADLVAACSGVASLWP